jgi:hypothetical protein
LQKIIQCLTFGIHNHNKMNTLKGGIEVERNDSMGKMLTFINEKGVILPMCSVEDVEHFAEHLRRNEKLRNILV